MARGCPSPPVQNRPRHGAHKGCRNGCPRCKAHLLGRYGCAGDMPKAAQRAVCAAGIIGTDHGLEAGDDAKGGKVLFKFGNRLGSDDAQYASGAVQSIQQGRDARKKRNGIGVAAHGVVPVRSSGWDIRNRQYLQGVLTGDTERKMQSFKGGVVCNRASACCKISSQISQSWLRSRIS